MVFSASNSLANIIKCSEACAEHTQISMECHRRRITTFLAAQDLISHVVDGIARNRGLFGIRYVNECHNGNFVY